jgi:hypothetical protein
MPATAPESANQLGAAGQPSFSAPVTSTYATLVVENNYTNLVVTGVFLSLSTAGEWGSNQLDGSQIKPGRSFTIERIPCGDYYDLKVTGTAGAIIGAVYNVFFACGAEKVVTLSP